MVEGTRILRFETVEGTYTFDNVQSFKDNFGELVTRASRFPGMTGGFDELGYDAGLGEIGSIEIFYAIAVEEIYEMTELVAAAGAMVEWGIGKLWMQPADPETPERYCYARLSNLSKPNNSAKHTDLFMRVQISFSVQYPRWMQDMSSLAIWGKNNNWGDAGLFWGGSGASQNVGSPAAAYGWGSGPTWGGGTLWGAATDMSLTYANDGNAISLPRLIFICTEAAASGITIERIEGIYVRESLSYTGAIALGQVLSIDCRALNVELDGVGAYNNFDYTHPAWLQLKPGANTLRIRLPSGGGKLRVLYPHTWA